MKKTSLILLFVSFFSFAKSAITVPSKMTFGNLKIIIKPGAKKIIAENIEKLKQNDSYFQSVVRRADIYFPIIQEKLKEVGVPDDIKYLCIQESELIAKAISSSNAVGYWQFKKATAEEVGLTVNSVVDERKNIASASLGAAKYIKKNNTRLDNWAYALLSYYTGLGGVQKYVKKQNIGASSMEINQSTHWYLLKFLSHKLAFEKETGMIKRKTRLIEYRESNGKTIDNIAKKNNVEKSEMEIYNAWINYNKKIPGNFPVIIPTPNNTSKDAVVDGKDKPQLIDIIFGSEKVDFESLPSIFTVNGVKAIVAKNGESFADLAKKVGKEESDLLKYNELVGGHTPEKNKHYFFEKKKKKAIVNFHTIQQGETLQSIAQQYGIKKTSILNFNRMKYSSELKENRILWMRKKRPKSTPVAYENEQIINELKPIIPINRDLIPEKTTEIITPVKEEKKTEIFDTIKTNFPSDPIQIMEESNEIEIIEKTVPELEKTKSPITNDVSEIAKKDSLITIIPKQESSKIEFPDEELEEELTTQQKTVKELKTESKNYSDSRFNLHTVAKGETLYSISKKYDCSVEKIKTFNKLTSNELNIEQELKIPIKIKTHTVVKGDTFYSISKKYTLSIDELKTFNSKKDFSLTIGEVLKLTK